MNTQGVIRTSNQIKKKDRASYYYDQDMWGKLNPVMGGSQNLSRS